MMFPEDPNQMFLCDVRVPLRRGNRSMSQELLHHANVRPIPQKQRGTCLAEHVRRNMPLDAGLFTQPRQHAANSLSLKASAHAR